MSAVEIIRARNGFVASMIEERTWYSVRQMEVPGTFLFEVMEGDDPIRIMVGYQRSYLDRGVPCHEYHTTPGLMAPHIVVRVYYTERDREPALAMPMQGDQRAATPNAWLI
jgi:hypothetical protein